MASRGDTLYKQLFAHPEIVRELLAGFLSADWARALAVEAFERVNGSYASESGRQRHDDVVWRANIGGEWLYVYILLEFQSRSDHWMALRMQVYVGLLCQDLVAQRQLTRRGKLPPVLPIVLYHGRRPWRAATDVGELMLPPPEGLDDFLPRQRYLLIDQHRIPPEPAGTPPNVVMILFRLMRAATDTELRQALNQFAARMRETDMAAARDSLARWILSVLQDEFSDTKLPVETSLMEEPAMLFNKRFKRYEDLLEYEAIERGKMQGREEGWQQGRQEGQSEGRRLALQNVLGTLLSKAGDAAPADIGKRIASADVNQLDRWVSSLLQGGDFRHTFADN